MARTPVLVSERRRVLEISLPVVMVGVCHLTLGPFLLEAHTKIVLQDSYRQIRNVATQCVLLVGHMSEDGMTGACRSMWVVDSSSSVRQVFTGLRPQVPATMSGRGDISNEFRYSSRWSKRLQGNRPASNDSAARGPCTLLNHLFRKLQAGKNVTLSMAQDPLRGLSGPCHESARSHAQLAAVGLSSCRSTLEIASGFGAGLGEDGLCQLLDVQSLQLRERPGHVLQLRMSLHSKGCKVTWRELAK